MVTITYQNLDHVQTIWGLGIGTKVPLNSNASESEIVDMQDVFYGANEV